MKEKIEKVKTKVKDFYHNHKKGIKIGAGIITAVAGTIAVVGKTMADIAHDGILTKLNSFPQEAEVKMRKTLSKITNEGKGGIICILL